jgi:chorismate synthase
MKSILDILPLVLVGVTVVSAGAVGQQKISQLEVMHEGALSEIREQSKQVQAVREEAARKDEALRSVDNRTKRIEDKLDRLLERR